MSSHAFCTGCTVAIPSIVVMFAPPRSFMAVEQERIAALSLCTVHAPQSDIPQPNLVPVSPATSRRYQSSGMSGSPSKVCSFPFTLKRIIRCPPGPMSCAMNQTILFAQPQLGKSSCLPQSPRDTEQSKDIDSSVTLCLGGEQALTAVI